MPPQQSPDVKFEIGHVLFIDIVGYSKLLIHEQSEQMQTLREIVRGTEQFRTAEAEGKLLRLPTGDGGALVFRTSPEAPVRCALEISKELKKHPELRVRMGIHSGAVNEITDLNEQANIAGAGINIAQRIMDCGDAGHILLSTHVAEDLEQYRQWQPYLHDLGECEVKHGVRVHAVNFYTDDVGNPAVPEKFKRADVEATGRRAVAERRRVSPSIIDRAHAAGKRCHQRQPRPSIFRHYGILGGREGSCLAATGSWTACSRRIANAELRRLKTALFLGSAPRRSALRKNRHFARAERTAQVEEG